jgi:hypothetical protein
MKKYLIAHPETCLFERIERVVAVVGTNGCKDGPCHGDGCSHVQLIDFSHSVE